MVRFILSLKRVFGSSVLLILFFLLLSNINAQEINLNRKKGLIYSYSTLLIGSNIGLYGLWYKDFKSSHFHFFNDNNQWLQLDKAGHFFSSYSLTKLSKPSFKWAGYSNKLSTIYASIYATSSLLMIEVMDGYSEEWGFSWGDAAANTAGVILFAMQELVFEKQAVSLKYSYSPSPYRKIRKEVLGKNWAHSLFKDYNAQTYWLSINFNDVVPNIKPNWLGVAIGYSGNEMVSANGEYKDANGIIYTPYRQYFLSLDVKLSKIKTDKKWLNTLFYVIDCIKLPLPTLEFSPKSKPEFHWLYF